MSATATLPGVTGRRLKRSSGVFLAAAYLIACSAAFAASTNAQASSPFPRAILGFGAGSVEMTSSVMWQPMGDASKNLYPPGIPAVLRRHEVSRTFRIEQYFDSWIDAAQLVPTVQGTWPRSSAQELRLEHKSWPDLGATALGHSPSAFETVMANQFMTMSLPSCDSEPSENGYRCAVDIALDPSTPTGTIGISLSLLLGQRLFTHPNSNFWIVLPEEEAQDFVKTNVPSPNAPAFRDDTAPYMPLSDARKYVVQISMGGSFSLGSGYITRSVGALAKLFNPEVIRALDLQSEPKIFIVTAAHLFPLGYSGGAMADPFGSRGSQPFPSSYLYDLHFENGENIDQAAVLLARNVESDVALLQVRLASTDKLATVLGVEDPLFIRGLSLARSVSVSEGHATTPVILGYPAAGNGDIVQRPGRLTHGEFPTDDTSNFGPLRKFKLEAWDPSDTDLAEPGMSGGPIVDDQSQVIGLTVERPNDTNSLVALDLTSIDSITSGIASNPNRCLLSFDPFDRILRIVREETACDYGRFGSAQAFAPLTGAWTVQEILGFDDAEVPFTDAPGAQFAGGRHQVTNGHSIINGHAIINGHSIINGHAIIRRDPNSPPGKDEVLIVNRENLSRTNQDRIIDGFKLNPDSFRSFVPKGIRILERPDAARTQAPIGSLILGTKDILSQDGYHPIYSIREFAIWLHRNVSRTNLPQLMCLNGSHCD